MLLVIYFSLEIQNNFEVWYRFIFYLRESVIYFLRSCFWFKRGIWVDHLIVVLYNYLNAYFFCLYLLILLNILILKIVNKPLLLNQIRVLILLNQLWVIQNLFFVVLKFFTFLKAFLRLISFLSLEKVGIASKFRLDFNVLEIESAYFLSLLLIRLESLIKCIFTRLWTTHFLYNY